MSALSCAFERLSNIGVGILLLLIGLGFTVIGVTVLPVIGLLFAAPAFIAGFVFLLAPKSRTCSLIVDRTRSYLTR